MVAQNPLSGGICSAQIHPSYKSDRDPPIERPMTNLAAERSAYVVAGLVWRWAFVPFGGQAVVAFLQNPTGSLLPLGLVVFAVFGVACLIPAYVGATLATAMGRR